MKSQNQQDESRRLIFASGPCVNHKKIQKGADSSSNDSTNVFLTEQDVS